MAKRVRLPKAERESFGRRQINDWAQGRQTIYGFCRQRGLTVSAFQLWKRQLSLKTTLRGEELWLSSLSLVRPLAARGCEVASRRLVSGASGISPVVVAVAGRNHSALPRS